jgi:hypothetical protein
MPLLPYYRPGDAWDGLRELTRVHDLASVMWWAERARLYVWSPTGVPLYLYVTDTLNFWGLLIY